MAIKGKYEGIQKSKWLFSSKHQRLNHIIHHTYGAESNMLRLLHNIETSLKIS